jgi:hypothetical protein
MSLRKLAVVATLLASAHSAQAMTYLYYVDESRLVIQATGDVEFDEGRRFLDFTDSLPRPVFALLNGKASIVFDSRGGNLHGAFVLANILSGYRLTTGIEGQCSSACVVIWAAGAHKTIASGSHIGVHSATLNGAAIAGVNGPMTERDYTIVMANWLRRNGAPPNVIAKMLSTPASGLYRLTDADLAHWHVTIEK